MKVTIECTANQLQLINLALDIYSRLGIGQIEAMKSPAMPIIPDWDKFYLWVDLFKQEVFALEGAHSYGIMAEKVSESCRAAYDMQQVIRHELWKYDGAEPGPTVDTREAFQTSKLPLIKVEIEK